MSTSNYRSTRKRKLWFNLFVSQNIDGNCGYCKQIFNKNDLVFCLLGESTKYHKNCYKLSENYVKYKIPHNTNMIINYDSSENVIKEQINNELFNCLLNEDERYQYQCLEYNVGDMDDNQLQFCLKQRDLSLYEPVSQYQTPKLLIRKRMIENLCEFFESEQVKEKHNLLIFGYRSSVAKKYSLQIPDYLFKIIFKYSPCFASKFYDNLTF